MSNVDLSQLSVDRGQETMAPTANVKRRWISRYVLPLMILLTFSGLLGWAAKDSILPSKPVTVVPVIIAKAQVQQAGTTLFQAAGWVEPRPMSVVVSSLAEGVVEELNVVAGQSVKKGDIIARLIDTDARIALAEARADLSIREADVTAARAELENAKTSLDNPVQLQADLAEAESAVARLEGELNGLPAVIEAAETKHELAEVNVEKKLRAGDAVAGRVLRDAKAELAGVAATLQTLQARQPVLKRQHEALVRRRDALAEKLELKLEEKRRIADAQAGLQAAAARYQRAKLAVETAELRMQRMTITAPIDGRVLSVQTAPGRRVNGLAPHSEQGASAVVTLYDPRMLQVRVDVRLEDVPQVQLGQEARIETASVQDTLVGEVVSLTSLADIQKNTLQIKVAVVDPPDVIRPEMLAQVEFLAPEQQGDQEESEDRMRLLIPRQLVAASGGASQVWVADQETRTARVRTITLGRAGTDELVEVTKGLTPTDKLISGGREGLTDNQRIRIASEDGMLGQHR
ncbi:MAG: HlyD family efflux transporter periplasmic adaptor subunit [Planctomycetota bacterium]|nr:MAG: HlyD family efflux transporter periplasmic adaptor subunit [Planctomycetota bacterium]REK46105.1 MAG: HlyD family efflux transporter periplasmic adaptor subunit [Planctomycetota bacterium]